MPDANQLAQYVIKLEEEDKFVLIYALFKLELIRGKTLLFVSSVDRCYKLKLYLEGEAAEAEVVPDINCWEIRCERRRGTKN